MRVVLCSVDEVPAAVTRTGDTIRATPTSERLVFERVEGAPVAEAA